MINELRKHTAKMLAVFTGICVAVLKFYFLLLSWERPVMVEDSVPALCEAAGGQAENFI